MNVKVATIVLSIVFVVCVSQGDAFTAGAGAPRRKGKREQVIFKLKLFVNSKRKKNREPWDKTGALPEQTLFRLHSGGTDSCITRFFDKTLIRTLL